MKENWEDWLPLVKQNQKTLAKIEKSIEDIHEIFYKNGHSVKVNTLWEWRRDIMKFIYTLLIAGILGIGAFVWNKVTDDSDKIMKEILIQLKEMKKEQ